MSKTLPDNPIRVQVRISRELYPELYERLQAMHSSERAEYLRTMANASLIALRVGAAPVTPAESTASSPAATPSIPKAIGGGFRAQLESL